MIKKETQEYMIMSVMSAKLWIVTKKILVSLVYLNQIFWKFTRICLFLSKLTRQECFRHLLYLIQTYLLLIMLAIAVFRSTCASTDLSLDTHDKYSWECFSWECNSWEILSILEKLQCSADQGVVEECTEHWRLIGNFVSNIAFDLSNKIFSYTEIRVL